MNTQREGRQLPGGNGRPTSSVRDSVSVAESLDLLGIVPDESLSVLVIPAGADRPTQPTGIRTAAELVRFTDTNPAGVNVWHSPAVMNPAASGRGKAVDVVRLPAVFADLDVKFGGLSSFAEAESLVEDLAVVLGTDPAYVTYSGHGLQPVWAVDPEDSTNVTRGAAVLSRFGRLVRHFAKLRNGGADSVFDLARVLRTPGSVNWKDPAHPVPVYAVAGGGYPLSWDELDEVLDAYAIPTWDNTTDGVVRVPVTSWEWADLTCSYVADMIERWGSATTGQRHPWLVFVAVKLCAARRAGCISEVMHETAVEVVGDRMRELCTNPPPGALKRPYADSELSDALTWAAAKVSTMTDTQVALELGDHHGTAWDGWARGAVTK